MFSRIRRMLDEMVEQRAPSAPTAPEHGYHLATATLLIEMIRADFDIHAVEERAVSLALRRAFMLDEQEVSALIVEAQACADEATSLHEFTRLINEQLTDAQKYHVIELLWQVGFADGAIDKYEEHLVRKVADLLYVRHSEFIRAKLSAQQNAG